jgi:hypothetical protein
LGKCIKLLPILGFFCTSQLKQNSFYIKKNGLKINMALVCAIDLSGLVWSQIRVSVNTAINICDPLTF